jgi:hypothetical protein
LPARLRLKLGNSKGKKEIICALELSPDRQQFANLFFSFIEKAKQPSPYELGCLLIVVSAVD